MAPLSGQAQPLTASDQGVWIDGNLQAPGGGATGMTSRSTTTSPKAKVTASWCDAHSPGGEALCTYPFGARFGRLAGYRSFAFDGPGYGSRIITNPLQPGGEDSTNMGSYLSLEGTTFQRLPGAGADNAPGGAFYSPTDGWLEGPVQITATAHAPAPGELAGVGARAVHRGRAAARDDAGQSRTRRRWRSAPMASSRATPPGRAGSANSC